MYKTFNYTSAIINANKTVNEIVYKLEKKIDDIFSALQTTKAAIQNMQLLNYTFKIRSTIFPCIKNETDAKFDDTVVTSGLYSFKFGFNAWNYNNSVLVLRKFNTQSHAKQQYFIFTSDLKTHVYSPFINCNKIDHMLLWNNFMSRNKYPPKNIVLLLDHGGSLSRRHFAIVLSIGKLWRRFSCVDIFFQLNK